MKTLEGRVAFVTGASRGIGKGIAIGLGEAGATVYLTGRTKKGTVGVQGLEGTIEETAKEVEKFKSKAYPLHCDHTNDNRVKEIFDHIIEKEQRLDILVNNVWGGYESMFNERGEYVWEKPFWEQPLEQWDLMFSAGVRAHYVASHYAADIMIRHQCGLIVNLSHWAAQQYSGNACYGVSKAATDKLTSDTAYDLKSYHVAVISLYPGLVRTERVMKAADFLDLSNSESPQFLGRVIASLYADPALMEKSGNVFVTAQLGLEYGVSDIDGKTPRPLLMKDV